MQKFLAAIEGRAFRIALFATRTPQKKQERLGKGARKWANMSPEQRSQAKERLNRFKDMTPTEREAVKRRMNVLRELPPEQRQAMREKWQSMTPEQRSRAITRWRSLTPEQRERIIQRRIDRQQRPIRNRK